MPKADAQIGLGAERRHGIRVLYLSHSQQCLHSRERAARRMSHLVTLQPSGHNFQVEPGESILRAGLAAGFALPFSCKQGVCRTCRGKLVSGQVDLGDVHPAYLNEADRAAGYVHLCQASALSDVTLDVKELEGLAGVTVKKVPCRIAKIERAAPDVVILHLRLPMNENMMFVAGQHVEFILPGDVRRTYSIATKPSVDGVCALEVHIRQVPGGLFSEQMLNAMKERELMKFEGPLGSFHLRDSDRPAVLIAGGTGFAPMKSMLEHVFERGVHKRRAVSLYWGARTRKDLYQLEVAERWAAERPEFRFVPVLSQATADCGWSGREGLVHEAVLQDLPNLAGVEIYACGAPGMIDACRRDFIGLAGLPDASFFADAFLTRADRAVTA